MKKIFILIFFTSFTSVSSMAWDAESYGNCVLENLKNTTGNVAAREIINICELKYKIQFKSSTICIETEGQTTNNIIFLKNINEPFSGYNYCKYLNGITKSKGEIQNGKKNNKWIWWHKNGNIGLEINYIESKKNGMFIKWYKDQDDLIYPISLKGQKQLEENYKDDKKDGKSTVRYPTGKILKERIYENDLCISGDC